MGGRRREGRRDRWEKGRREVPGVGEGWREGGRYLQLEKAGREGVNSNVW